MDLLTDGSHWGVRFPFAEQPKPEGIAQAFMIGRESVGQESVALVLGDNILYGHGLSCSLMHAAQLKEGAVGFGFFVKDGGRYGAVQFDATGRVLSIEEKLSRPRSHYAVTGLYFYESTVCDIAQGLTPSARRELEIADVNREYLKGGRLGVEILSRGMAWLDTGTHGSLLHASNFVEALES